MKIILPLQNTLKYGMFLQILSANNDYLLSLKREKIYILYECILCIYIYKVSP